jgi:superfamily I DNA and/or RNA helicase
VHVQVICATCAAAGSDMLAGATFPLVVLDEASQAAEPEALIPLTRGAEHVVHVGDHLQLPPVCNSEAAAAGLAVSLFERLMVAGVPSAMLQVGHLSCCVACFV